MGKSSGPGAGTKVPGRAPRARTDTAQHSPHSIGASATEHENATEDATGGADGAVSTERTEAPSKDPAAPKRGATELVADLSRVFIDNVQRALAVDLNDPLLRGTETTLAYVDHYIKMAKAEERAPIVALLAAGAGAFYGELVRTLLGGTWVGDAKDPRRLRMLMSNQFVHFSPIDQTLEAIAGRSLEPDDGRLQDDSQVPFDPAFVFRPPRDDDELDPSSLTDAERDALWLEERLGELSKVPEAEFVTLTCRFETLKLMLEMLAAKHQSEGKSPRTLGIEDYLQALQ